MWVGRAEKSCVALGKGDIVDTYISFWPVSEPFALSLGNSYFASSDEWWHSWSL